MFRNLLIAITFLVSFQLWSQDYKPLIDTINEWHFTTCYFGCLTDVYYTDGDTIVNGNEYKVLDGYHYISRTFLIREEVENKKVFMAIVTETDFQEYLLYDFSLNEGEEIDISNPISPFPENGGLFVIDSIRYRELVDENEYRHFYLSPIPSNTSSTDPAVWVEGVGSLSLINAPGGHPAINSVGSLSCFFKDTDLFYSNLDSIDVCEPIHLGLIRPINFLDKVEILTTLNNCTIINTETIVRVTVYGLSGNKIHSFLNKNRKSSLKIDLSSLSKGIYIIIVTNENNNKKTFKTVVY